MFDAATLEKFQTLETPFFYYDLRVLEEILSHVRELATKHDYHVHYAMKANANVPLLEQIKAYGFGVDCVSGNEIQRALDVGFDPKSIVFAGVGKTDKEIHLALAQGICTINCESLHELAVINEIATHTQTKAPIALRVNPGVDPKTHKFITTGLEENKFGLYPWNLEEALNTIAQSEHLEFLGLHFHIGSQITDLTVFKGLCLRINELQTWLDEHHIDAPMLNVGGGLGVDYHHPDQHRIPNFDHYFSVFSQFLEVRPKQTVHFELGRALVAQCGSLISRVLYVKEGEKTDFVILDAGMTELIRPALYQSFHTIQNLVSDRATHDYDVVGPICESSDCFGKAVALPETQRGDLIAIRSTGAYGEIMASQYNLRDKAPAVYSE